MDVFGYINKARETYDKYKGLVDAGASAVKGYLDYKNQKERNELSESAYRDYMLEVASAGQEAQSAVDLNLTPMEVTNIPRSKADVTDFTALAANGGIIGLRNQLLTATAGEAIMTHRFKEYKPVKGGIPERQNGSLVSMEKGKAIPYSIDKLQDRGKFFVNPGEEIYEGQVIGENSRGDDMVINITKTKKMSNVRSSGADDKAKIVPAIKFSLEEALEYIQKDEYVEVTPNSLRLRKVLLKEVERKRNKSNL